jgi:hypothetical protein
MAQFQFVMRSGPTPGVTFPLDGDQLTIGRDATNGVAINDAEVSRKHARLMFQGGKYVLEDLGSTNGTFVNGQRLAGPVVLKSGDVVSLGEQIVLMYDAISSDAGATMAVSRKSVPSAPAPPILRRLPLLFIHSNLLMPLRPLPKRPIWCRSSLGLDCCSSSVSVVASSGGSMQPSVGVPSSRSFPAVS